MMSNEDPNDDLKDKPLRKALDAHYLWESFQQGEFSTIPKNTILELWLAQSCNFYTTEGEKLNIQDGTIRGRVKLLEDVNLRCTFKDHGHVTLGLYPTDKNIRVRVYLTLIDKEERNVIYNGYCIMTSPSLLRLIINKDKM